jgi:putative ABC transport system permease protein
MAVRQALGAKRSRLVRELLAESVSLALGGAGVGLALASWATELLEAFDPRLPVPVPLRLDLPIDAGVIVFTLVLAAVCGLLLGLPPALHATRPALTAKLRYGAAAGDRSGRLRDALVIAQVALAAVLLVTAGLFLRVLQRAATADPGFRTAGVAAMTLDSSLLRIDDQESWERYRLLLERVRALPGVAAASLSTNVPLAPGRHRVTVVVPAHPTADADEPPRVDASWVSAGYFETLASPIVAGRPLGGADRMDGPPAAVVSAAFATRFWPGEDALGRSFEIGRAPEERRTVAVVGVAADVKVISVDEAPTPFVYLPLAQQPLRRVTLLVRGDGRAPAIATLRAEVDALDPELPVLSAMPLDDVVAAALLPQKIAAAAAGLLGLVGLGLAAVGLYGLIAFSVARRVRELGVRMALGAGRRQVAWLVTRRGVFLALAGVVPGLLLSLVLSRALTGLLHGLDPADPVTYLAIGALLIATALAASWLPARRAARIDTVAALRRE